MKTGSTVGLAIVAAALVAGAMYYGQQEQVEIESAAAPTKTITSGVTSNTVERIEIAVPGETPVTLRQKDDVWYSNLGEGHRADKNAVNAVFQALEKEISGEVVSENEESFEDYQVTETSGTRVRVFETGKTEPTEDLIIGKDGGAAFTTYVREADSKEVVNANAALSYTFKRPDGWRDKVIVQIPQDSVTRISAEGTSSTFTLAKNEAGTWKVTQPDLGDAQPTKVNPILSNLANLRATDFAQGDARSAGLEPPHQKLTITYEDKATSPSTPKTTTLLIGSKKVENSTYYVKLQDSPDIYLIGEYLVNSFTPEPNTLALNPPAAPEETTSTVKADQATTSGEVSAAGTEGTEGTAGTTEASATPAPTGTPTPAPTATPTPTPAPTATPTPTATPAPITETTETTGTAGIEPGSMGAQVTANPVLNDSPTSPPQ